MRALVVDDSTSSRAAITGALGRAGFQVFEKIFTQAEDY